jgi:tRNA A37 threonylcarbamoyladenosine synthetase subunit TsaC/SUA5/YrdC
VTTLQIEQDARKAFDVLKAGGIAILPNDVGYSLIGGSTAALNKIFETKQRVASKLNAMLGNLDIHREIHVLTSRQREIVEALVVDYDLPLGLIAQARMDHPLLRGLDAKIIQGSTKAGTICMLLNAGRFHEAICRMSMRELHPLFGSSANKTMTGTKFRVEDIEPEIKAIADVVIDYGLRKFHLYKASSTLLEIESMSVIRRGSCFELIADALRRHFEIELPPAKPN